MTLVSGLARALGGDGYEGVEGLTYSLVGAANVFEGFLPANPNRVVSVIPSGGFEADSGLPYDEPTIQLIVRSDDDPTWALDMWQSVYSWLQGLSAVTLPDGTYVVSAIAMQSGPIHIGKDESGRFQYGMNFRFEIKNPTAKRPE